LDCVLHQIAIAADPALPIRCRAINMPHQPVGRVAARHTTHRCRPGALTFLPVGWLIFANKCKRSSRKKDAAVTRR